MLNKQAFRHIERPGSKLSWTWQNKEVIWSMSGAEATEQGDCTRIPGRIPPHYCKKQPEIIDLLPGAPYNMQTSNRCKGGVLTTEIQDPLKHGAYFQMSVGKELFMEIINGTATPSVNQTAPAEPPPADDGDKEKLSPSKDVSYDKEF
ncbi:COBRA-like protein 2 [Papaver somniferum]|uniref:COBRA-like protein 2 n=1 Tax=Papaver somniferum TaxID=3469 RepID=UPI000E7021B5|nr:COBRA-like protein 2 [Papaver somniferum]